MSVPARVPAPHLLLGALAGGLALALAVRAPGHLLAAAAAAAIVAVFLLDPARTVALAAALAAAGWWWGSVRLESLGDSVLRAEVGRAATARVEVTGPARRNDVFLRVPVRVLAFGSQDVSERARLELPRERAPPQGAILELVVSVRAPAEAGPGERFDERAYLRRQGVHVVLRADRFRIVGRRGGLAGMGDRLRAALAASLAPGVEGERRAVIAGVVLGEDEGLERDLLERFRASGLYHLLAVSGQNVAYVVAGVVFAAWAVGLSRRIAQAAALVAVAGYVLAVGWQPSVVRAGVAGGLACLAWLASRPRDRWYFLLVGAAVLLAWSPYSLLEPGFQLSFSAVAAIFVLVPRLERVLEGYPVPRRLAEVIAVSGACGAVTAPVLMLHFGAVPVYAVASNALAAPVVAPLLGLGLAAAALDGIVPEAAAALGWLNGWAAAYLAFCARLFGGLPGARITAWPLLLALAGLVAAAVALARLPPPRGRRALALGALALVLLAGWQLLPERGVPPPNGLRLTFLDVGQGDAVLLEVPEGAVLVDQGPPEADVAGQLETLGVRRLAALVLTHPQRDHVGGAADVLRRLEVGFVLDPRLAAASPHEQDALAAARDEGVRVVTGRAGQVFRLGRLRLRVLWPEGPGSPGADPNDHAIVILASYGRLDALLTADAETNVTAPLRPPRVEILKVAHHGSADPGLPALLAAVSPDVAVVSAGEDNDYGHPAPSTLAALAAFPGVAVYRTDRDGRVTIESDGLRLSVRDER